jgi:threonine dehydrogenase-like Zn-dependent dehydrogenase
VLSAPAGSDFSEGDLVVGIVRRPDPRPCVCCAEGQFDMCRNGEYTERGIKSIDGYGAEHWRVEPDYALRLDPALERVGVLCEPTTVVAKAWEEIERVMARSCAKARTAVVTGAGPIGLLAALLAVQRGLETWVVDIVSDGVKPQLVRDLGAHYHCGSITELDVHPDAVLEATGVAPVVLDAIRCARPDGVVCLAGVSPTGEQAQVDVGALNNALVLGNRVVLGSVNANRTHYEAAAKALAQADAGWLDRLITRRVPLEDWADALERRDGDVKVVVDFDGG